MAHFSLPRIAFLAVEMFSSLLYVIIDMYTNGQSEICDFQAYLA